MPSEAILTILITAHSVGDVEECQKKIRGLYGNKASVSRIMPAKTKPGQFIGYCDVFAPDGIAYLETPRS